jgi:hypothetical protein
VVSFLLLYATLLIVALTGRLFLCSNNPNSNGSVFGNIQSLLELRKQKQFS